jgi:hypothetical protein
MSRLHMIAQCTLRNVPTVAFTTGDSSRLWLCHRVRPPKSSLSPFKQYDFILGRSEAWSKGKRSFSLWKNVVAVENSQCDACISSILGVAFPFSSKHECERKESESR